MRLGFHPSVHRHVSSSSSTNNTSNASAAPTSLDHSFLEQDCGAATGGGATTGGGGDMTTAPLTTRSWFGNSGSGSGGGGGDNDKWSVRLCNDDVHTFDQVMSCHVMSCCNVIDI